MRPEVTMDMETALSQTHQVPVILAEFEFDSQTVGMWTGFGTLTWGEKTFFGGGNLVGMSEIKETQDLVANGIVFNLNGIDPALIEVALDENLQSRPCRVYFGIVNVTASLAQESGDDILLEDGGSLLLESQLIDNPICVFSGMMDVVEGAVEVPVASIRLSAENILAILRRSKISRYTHEEQISRYPGDKFFEFIAALQDKEITW